jgi:hypothetical protein
MKMMKIPQYLKTIFSDTSYSLFGGSSSDAFQETEYNNFSLNLDYKRKPTKLYKFILLTAMALNDAKTCTDHEIASCIKSYIVLQRHEGIYILLVNAR